MQQRPAGRYPDLLSNGIGVETEIQDAIEGTLLLVDGDPSFRLATTASLRRMGLRCIEAVNGQAALESLEKATPNMILLDAELPRLSGFDLCRLIREYDAMHHVPIMIMTGAKDSDAVHRAYEAGATTFISKPLDYTLLYHQLRFMIRVAGEVAELRERLACLSTAYRIARIGYWRWDSRSDEFELSEQLKSMCGLPPSCDRISRLMFAERIHEQDRHKFERSFNNAQGGGRLAETDFRLLDNGPKSLQIHQRIERVNHTSRETDLIGTIQDVTRQKETEAQVAKLAYTDTLTGLGSRTYLLHRLQECISTATRKKSQCTILFLDLDGFKDINDSMGHDAGDEFLKIVAERIRSNLRKSDFAARFGGDEFCIILDELNKEFDAASAAQHLLDTISVPLNLYGRQLVPRASIGVAIHPKDGNNATTLLKSADNAMYAAKGDGKHSYAFYRPELTLQAEQRLIIEQELRLAIEQNQLEIHYQPQVSLLDGRLHGVEALVRWQHPKHGLVYPDKFIPVAEKTGLIIPLERKVLEMACRQTNSWHEQGLSGVHLAVNISPQHFACPTLIDTVQQCLSAANLQPQRLELEITESSIQIAGKITPNFRALGSLGINIAIDDFGTGYSSLGSLKDLPVTRLKIDRVFIKDIVNDIKSSIFVGSIIGLAHALGMEVIAEGAEHIEQIEILHGLGCNVVQGYYFSRPLTGEQIYKMVNENAMHWPRTSNE